MSNYLKFYRSIYLLAKRINNVQNEEEEIAWWHLYEGLAGGAEQPVTFPGTQLM